MVTETKPDFDLTYSIDDFEAGTHRDSQYLYRAIEDADRTLGSVLNKAKLWQRINRQPVNERQRKVINRMLDDFKGHLTTSKYAKLVKCSSDTALRDIRELVERRILLKNRGGGRSTSYRLADPDEVR